jgi:hypothetical protein
MKRLFPLVTFTAGLVLLSACAGPIPSMPSNGGPGVGEPQAASPTSTPTLTPVPEDVQDDGEPQAPPAPSATPTVRPGLEATDPESVDLASGKPTLLQFFAFW